MIKIVYTVLFFIVGIPAIANPILHFGDMYSVQMSPNKTSSPTIATHASDGAIYYASLITDDCSPIKIKYAERIYSVCDDCTNYTKVEYLASTGHGEYIDTGISVTSQNRNKIRLEFVFSGTPGVSWNIPIGIGYAAKSPYCFLGIGQGMRIAYGDAGDIYIGVNLSSENIETFHYYSIDYITGKIKIDDNVIHNFTPKTYNTDYVNNLYMFTWNTGGVNLSYQYIPMKIKYAKIFIDNELVRDYIPVLNSFGRPAMRDRVSGKCFYNQGGGRFLYQ